jgi:MFS family permease
MAAASPFQLRNIRLFIAFRVCFNARFYYPVFTILFLDYGLSIEQFALLNTVWAITIVLTEVPSGALADLLGRKRLLVLTSVLMIIELSVIAFIPLASSTLIFWAFLINRILSGLAEAMASGADEAIAYDTLSLEGDANQWPRVLGVQMRIRSIAAMVSMTVGALVYDPDVVNTLIHLAGSSLSVDQQTTMRFPVYLTLVLAVAAFITTLRLKEPHLESADEPTGVSCKTLIDTSRQTLRAGRWILTTPFALAIILYAMLYDHVLRMMITLTSQYLRLIDLPEASFGVIMAALSLLGLAVARLAEWMVQRFSPAQNAGWLALLTMVTLIGLTGFIPYFGLIPMSMVMVGLLLTDFFTSHYLNKITSSKLRATVLSFKGLAYNLAYGAIGVLFALLMHRLRGAGTAAHPDWSAEAVEHGAFRASIGWFPWYALALIGVVTFFSWYLLRGETAHRTRG